MDAQVSVRECVGAALRFVRKHWRRIAIAAVIGAGLTAALTAVSLSSPLFALFVDVANWLVQSFVFAVFVKAELGDKDRFRAADGLRMFGAMTVIGFFLFLVFFVLMIPGAVVLVAGPMAPYVADMQAAGQDQAAMMRVMMRFAQENPAPLLAFFAFYGILWFLLTSRLYLVAPATMEAKRVLTFDTWRWTRGMTLKIAGARIMLLVPAFILMAALTYLAARSVGIDPTSATQRPSLPIFASYILMDRIVFFAAYLALEAGLSTALYRALKPAASK
ncbi:MAG: hypothetical protein JSS00_02535 [Proteobacteria bacterium]|nr:hypothetical protein [Pseudomonadota bacterium]